MHVSKFVAPGYVYNVSPLKPIEKRLRPTKRVAVQRHLVLAHKLASTFYRHYLTH